VRVSWDLKSSDDALRRYELQVSADHGSWTALSLPAATSTARWVTLAGGHDYRFRVRAVDAAGRVGSWRTTGDRRASMVGDGSSAVVYSGSWGTASYASYLAGKVHYTRSAGATASLRFSGSGIVVVGPRGPGRGRSVVYIDGHAVATIDQVASSFTARRVLFARNLSAGTHTIVVKSLGTAGRPMVAIDAIEVLSPS
jgi:hypothetical protein